MLLQECGTALRTRMVIDTIFLYSFVDSDLMLEIFFERQGQQKKGGFDY